MKKIFLILIFGIAFCSAKNTTKEDIANSIKSVAKSEQIDERILYTIAYIESKLEPYTINFITNEKFAKRVKRELDKAKYDVKISKYNKTSYAVGITSKQHNAILALASALYELKMNIDLGIMQISKQNIKKDELENIFNPRFNLEKSALILKKCGDKYSKFYEIIECYNKGFIQKKSYSYFRKFATNYNTFFGDNK
ncbi:transglycosylase SLT domain-containing protein [Campylobacter fetus]|uniref:transglycosylase SLT domain-containing protein n=1 Tax=Campylobacter fetus TaxID=196 RepID=UPI0009C16176|nr:transglycosylase SLT domain-containing protein [Campylobacter fetus]